jgi:predicted Zn finger-like uncharacterized protein
MSSSTHFGEVMETCCDQCNSRFRITETQLRQVFGQVRCGECGNMFNALLALKNYEGELPPDYYERQSAPGPDTTVQNEALSKTYARRQFSLDEAMYGSERRSFFVFGPLTWFIAILLLSALGVAQSIYYQRYQLIEDPRFQQQVINLCQMLPCAENQFSSSEQLRLLERNVFTHPVASDALMVTGSFINKAPFAQKMPDLLISLFDVQGKPIANRLFKPNEYLLEDRNRSVIPPQSPIQFRLEIVDPGTEALTYEFEFY